MNRPDFRTRHYPVLDILDVHDGDTFRFMLDVGFEGGEFPWLRLKGYSCPELDKPGGAAAREAALNLLTTHRETLWVTTFKLPGYVDTRKTLTRYVADVYLDGEGNKLGALLAFMGHAVVGQKVG